MATAKAHIGRFNGPLSFAVVDVDAGALFFEAGVDDDGDGAVVDERDLHLGAEDATLGGFAQQACHLVAVGFIEWHCQVMSCRKAPL